MITLSLGEAMLAGGAVAVVSGLVGIGAHRLVEGVVEGFAAARPGRRAAPVRHEPAVSEPAVAAPAVAQPAPAVAASVEPAAEPTPEPAPEPEPEPAAQTPWLFPLLADDLHEPSAPQLPEHPWHRNPTGPLPRLPKAAVWPAAPRGVAVTTTVAGQARTDRIEVAR